MLIDGEIIRLSPGQHAVFMRLWNARGAIIPADILYDALSTSSSKNPPFPQILKVHMFNLRRRIAKTNFRVKTHPKGRGYQLLRIH